jgi:hypothetical protein
MENCLVLPGSFNVDTDLILQLFSVDQICEPKGKIETYVGGQKLIFPYRIYYSENAISAGLRLLDGTSLAFAHLLISRHHDGGVRQEALRNFPTMESQISAAFSIQLLGEYVVEIGQLIENRMNAQDTQVYKEFALSNSSFVKLTKQRIVSYWDCYYRSRFRSIEDYPNYRVFKRIFHT